MWVPAWELVYDLPIGTFPLSFDWFTLYWEYYQAIRHTVAEASELSHFSGWRIRRQVEALDGGSTTPRIVAISA
jgi:hypothetical protein